MTIVRMKARIERVTELSPSAREVVVVPERPLPFIEGAFVNVFMIHNGRHVRRAYSISSSHETTDRFTLSIRKGSPEGMSIRFWDPDIVGREIEIMGPLGLNTADKITRRRIFLFGFGIGVSVIKSILSAVLVRSEVERITVVTGNRNEEETLYKTYLEDIRARDPRVNLRFVLSRPKDDSYAYRGYIQDHMGEYDFTDASVYICGPNGACYDLKKEILARAPDAEFFIEAFD